MFHDTFSIQYGSCKVPTHITGKDKQILFHCDHSNTMFRNVRDQHIIHGISELTRSHSRLESKLEAVKQLKGGESLELTKQYMFSNGGDSEMKKDMMTKEHAVLLFKMCEYIQQLRNSPFIRKTSATINYLSSHTPHLVVNPNMQECRNLQSKILLNAREEKNEIIRMIQEFMLRQTSPEKSFISISLLSIFIGGFSHADFTKLKKIFIHTYGCSYLFDWNNLEKLTLISTNTNMKKSTKKTAGTILDTFQSFLEGANIQKYLKTFNMLPEIGLDNCQDTYARTTAGLFVPMIVSPLESIIKEKPLDEKAKSLIVGGVFDSGTRSVTNRNRPTAEKHNTANAPIVLLYFIGGLTYMEISALRLLGEQLNVQFIFCTDGVINSEDFIGKLLQE